MSSTVSAQHQQHDHGKDGFLLPHGPLDTQQDDLDTRLNKHAEYFDMMVDLIPPEFYIHRETPEDDNAWKRYKKGSAKHTAPKQQIKENTKKAKKLKYSESGEKTTTDIQKELRQEDEKERQQVLQQQNNDKKSKTATSSSQGSKAKSLEELRERLRAKIAERKQQRGAQSNPTRESGKKRKASQSYENARPSKSSMKGKSQNTDAFGDLNKSNSGTDTSREAVRHLQESLSYGVFKVGDEKKAEAVSAALGKKGSQGKNKKNLKSLLAKAEQNQKKLQQATEEKKDAEWDAAMKRAEGEKVLDDPKLLKKTLKRKQKAKQKSRKQWEERKELTEQKKKAKQEKRQTNLQQRKTKGGKNTQNLRAGFEGTNTKILNK
eukprot:gb/GECG01015957.1/.p1 GENE.gb/GECG01015957.1/~~gb/GECG01015957.1/.p1  ORF type:complete len:377 (+),score=105.16 gb/GECG01015957.1/:1-1131(+)